MAVKRYTLSCPDPDGFAIEPFDADLMKPTVIVRGSDYDALEARVAVLDGSACAEEQAAGNGPCGACTACLRARLAEAAKLNMELMDLRASLEARLAEAMRLLAKEDIHMDDHGCWCNPTVTDYSDSKVKHE